MYHVVVTEAWGVGVQYLYSSHETWDDAQKNAVAVERENPNWRVDIMNSAVAMSYGLLPM